MARGKRPKRGSSGGRVALQSEIAMTGAPAESSTERAPGAGRSEQTLGREGSAATASEEVGLAATTRRPSTNARR